MKLPSYPSLTSLESLMQQDGVDASLMVDQVKRLLIRQLMQYTNNNHSLYAPAAPPRIAASDSIYLVVSLASCSSSASLSLPSSVYDHYYLAQDTAYTLPLLQSSINSRQRQQHRRHTRIQLIVATTSSSTCDNNAPQTVRRQRLIQLRAYRQTSRHLTAAQQTTTTEQSMMVAEAMSSQQQQQPAKEEEGEEEGQPPPDDWQQPPHRHHHHLQLRLSFVEEEGEMEEQLPLHSDDDARKEDSYSRSRFFLLPHRGIKVLTGDGGIR